MRSWRKGNTAHSEYKRQYRKDNPEQMTRSNKKYRKANRERLNAADIRFRAKCYKLWMVLLGDRHMLECSKCGYNRCFAALDFHHVDPKKKEFYIGNILRRIPTPERIAELDKVIPLCCRCHRELHAGYWD